jgi:hypothetical protein
VTLEHAERLGQLSVDRLETILDEGRSRIRLRLASKVDDGSDSSFLRQESNLRVTELTKRTVDGLVDVELLQERQKG